MEITYKGFVVRSTPMKLAVSKEWQIRVFITNLLGGSLHGKTFTAKNTYKTKEEADNNSIKFGKEIIDGICQDHSVSDM